jgi:hypothetical protein
MERWRMTGRINLLLPMGFSNPLSLTPSSPASLPLSISPSLFPLSVFLHQVAAGHRLRLWGLLLLHAAP